VLMSPLISIITTTYKHQDFIAYTIESILVQTHIDRELLIGDDSPDDVTWNVIQEYVAKYPNKIKARNHTPNKWLQDNMNFLYTQINPYSQYIAFLEGDDMYNSHNLTQKIAVFEQHPDVSFVSSHHRLINEQGQWLAWSPLHFPHAGKKQRTILDLLAAGNPIHSFGSVMMTRNLAQTIFPLTMPPQRSDKMFGPLDYWTWTRMLPHCVSYGLDAPLLIYRKQANNYTKQVRLFNQQLEVIYRHYIHTHQDNPEIVKICQRFIIANEIIGRMIEWSWSFLYRRTNKKYFDWRKHALIMFAYTVLWYCPRWIFTPLYTRRLSRKYKVTSV